MKKLLLSLIVIMSMSAQAHAFCGFYVAKADASLFNKASKVVMAHHEDRTVITMASDFQGDVKDFAIVTPVPTIIKESQVNIGDNKVIDHIDAYTAPRLVEYYDDNPCAPRLEMMMARSAMQSSTTADSAMQQSAKAMGVTIEESFSVGEYDILVLSAKQSDGLLTWLNQEGYKLPEGAEPVLNSYIKQDMKFFIAKVNLDKFEKEGFTYLRPIQVAYESKKFMLPIRLGTLNANGPQDLLLFTLTKNGRVEPTNYRTVKIPTGDDIPLFVADEFGAFYKAMFAEQVKRNNMRTVFLEYAWDMAWCDPCAADPVPSDDLRKMGAWWIDNTETPRPVPMGRPQARRFMPPQAVDVFVTRMHVRYDAKTFPEDITLQVTDDRENFQGRYVMRHPYDGKASCEMADGYYAGLEKRFEKEAKNLANLTGWDINMIREKMEKNSQSFDMGSYQSDKSWWEDMWR